MKTIKERIVKNYKTTLLGVVIAGLSIIALKKGYATWDQIIGFLTLSGLLTWVKDTIFKTK